MTCAADSALVISTLSLLFAITSWRQANRPLVTARIATAGSGNQATALNLVVENTGNRPARNIRLSVSPSAIQDVLHPDQEGTKPPEVDNCFSDHALIPVLANGRSVSNAFGQFSLSEGNTWKPWSLLTVTVTYGGLGFFRFSTSIKLRLGGDESFGGWSWSSTPQRVD